MGGLSVFILLGILMSMFFVFIIIIFIVGLYLLINYIFESIFLYTVSKENHDKYPITSWIPFYNKCILGKVANKKSLGNFLCIIDIITVILILISYFAVNLPPTLNTTIFFLIIILLVVSFILNIVLSHHIIKKVTEKLVDVLTILNVLTLGFTRSIILFIIRNHRKLKQVKYVKEVD